MTTLNHLPAPHRWLPISLEELLADGRNEPIKVLSVLFCWVLLIAGPILSVLFLIPESWVSAASDQSGIVSFFMLYPPLVVGTLLLFWIGFEWGFIPVFLSSFVIAFAADMPVQWSLLFAISFVLGMGIYALAYYCVPVSIDMRSIKSVAFFTVVSLVAAMASSLGSFVWSLHQGLDAIATTMLWNGWWTGAFFQSMLIVAPFLFLATPTVYKWRGKIKQPAPQAPVTVGWIYGAISSVVVVVLLFVIGGRMMGNQGIQEALVESQIVAAERIVMATESYQMIFWISIGIILTVGFTGVYLVSSWNRVLKEEVDHQTEALLRREEELEQAVSERDRLLSEIHGRVQSNLGIVLALFELQLKRTGDNGLIETLRDSKSRVRAISLLHELMSQSGSHNTINLKVYAIKLYNRLNQDYRREGATPAITLHASTIVMNLERSVPVCMIVNELLSRLYERLSVSQVEGYATLELASCGHLFEITVRDHGNLPPGFFQWNLKNDIGIRLIRSLAKQIQGDVECDDAKNEITIVFPVSESEKCEHPRIETDQDPA
ncbi:MAG: sensor histidine kinase [Balneolaceae bacterium]